MGQKRKRFRLVACFWVFSVFCLHFEAKIREYCAVGVREAWMVSLQAETVEVLRLSSEGAETVVIYGNRQTLQSVTFPDLTIALADVFAA